MQYFLGLSNRGSETGGLLLGSSVGKDRRTLTVTDIEPIEIEYTRGPLYRLSEADAGRFKARVDWYNATKVLDVIGFYRAHTRKGLWPDKDDAKRFGIPPGRGFLLLIKPFAVKPPSAGLFIQRPSSANSDEWTAVSHELEFARSVIEK